MIALGALFWTTTSGSTPPAPVITPHPGGGPQRRARAEDEDIIMEAIEGFLKGDRWRTNRNH